jgi:CHAD domain-containing protein
MHTRLPSDLLDRSAQESSRLLALSYLSQIDRARDRLDDPLDREALHDFRVGVRRLRSVIRAYRTELEGSVTGKMRRRLKDLARATNDGRDVEVQLTWLGRQADRLAPEDGRGFFWFAGRLEDRKQAKHDHAIADVARRYEKLAIKLRKALGVLRIELDVGQGQRAMTFREATGALVHRQVARVREDLGRIRDSSDADQVHRTRISLKRLRYLLEPIARRQRRASALVRRFKEAQDLLGEHHDMHVLSSTIAALRAGLPASGFSGLEPGVDTLARMADEAAKAAFDRFQSLWSGEQGNRILTRADELGRALEEPAAVEVAQPRVASHESPVPSGSGATPLNASEVELTATSDEPLDRELATRDS